MKKRIKKLMAMGLIMMMAATMGLVGCGTEKSDSSATESSSDSDVTQGTAEFKIITAMSDTVRTEVLDYVMDQLAEKYPNVTFVNESGEDYNNTAKLAFSSGSGYELVLTDDLGISALRDAGYLLDLSEYIEDRGWEEKQMEGATNFYNLRTPNEQYTVGLNYAPVVVYYNKTIFEELDLEIPKTVEEFENVLKTASEKGYIGSENCKDTVSGWYIQSLVQNYAPFDDVLKWYYLEESKDSMKDAFIKSTNLVKKWSDAGYFRENYEGIEYGDVPSLFAKGESAVSLDGNWFLYDYENSGVDVGVFTFPGVEESETDNYIINPVDAAFAVGKHVDDTQLAVALDFIDLMLTKEAADMWMERGSISTLNVDFSDGIASPLTQELLKALEGTKSGFYLDNVKPGFLEVFSKEMQLALSEQQSAEDMWGNIDKFWHE